MSAIFNGTVYHDVVDQEDWIVEKINYISYKLRLGYTLGQAEAAFDRIVDQVNVVPARDHEDFIEALEAKYGVDGVAEMIIERKLLPVCPLVKRFKKYGLLP